ncbi:hypothetical protein BX600DRAFT_483648 [Xylariales sp. PMI_506]|nr:hypothetical protein BX600DRAFT_483648 [Xylariales sp. PMI_506]
MNQISNHCYKASHVPHLEVPALSYAGQFGHVHHVAEHLKQRGIIKLSLQFSDDRSDYLKQLIQSFHKLYGHQLPISHSATCGWFWDVRPKTSDFQAKDHQARSETMDEFPWHTDCSYEDPSPRYFALQVLQHDRFGGGTLSVMNVQQLYDLLSPETRAALACPEYQINIPPEFIKDPMRQYIIGSLLEGSDAGGPYIMRFRADIVTPLSRRASTALSEMSHVLRHMQLQLRSAIHLSSDDLPERSIIILDNRRWLHSRNQVKDAGRHLRRVRWDAIPFHGKSRERSI